jgi:hypothetical protein
MAKMSLAEHNDMVKAVPADRTSAPPHIRSVMAIVVRSADLECPWLEAASSRALDRNIIG